MNLIEKNTIGTAIFNENLCLKVPLVDECFILDSFTFCLKTTVLFCDHHCDGVFVSTSQICRTWPLRQNFMLQLCYLTLNADYVVVVKKAINLYCLFSPWVKRYSKVTLWIFKGNKSIIFVCGVCLLNLKENISYLTLLDLTLEQLVQGSIEWIGLSKMHFKIWKKPLLVEKQMIHQQKALDLSFHLAPWKLAWHYQEGPTQGWTTCSRVRSLP